MDSAADIRREALLLLRSLGVPAEEMRGLGLAVSRLDNDPASHTAKPSAPAPARLQVRISAAEHGARGGNGVVQPAKKHWRAMGACGA